MTDFEHYPKFSNSTLARMTKAELIDQIHCLLNNWRACAESKENILEVLSKEQRRIAWRCIKDGLPEENAEVLLWDNWNKTWQLGYLSYENDVSGEWITGDMDKSSVSGVDDNLFTHWKYIEPPTE